MYRYGTQEDLMIVCKLAEQQKKQRAPKIKNTILQQTHDVKLAEPLSPINKELDEVKECTRKLREVVEEGITPRLAMENTHNALPIKNKQIHPGVIYNTALENTIIIIKNNNDFFNIEERDNGYIFPNVFPVEKMGGDKFKTNEKIYDTTPEIQKVLNDTSTYL